MNTVNWKALQNWRDCFVFPLALVASKHTHVASASRLRWWTQLTPPGMWHKRSLDVVPRTGGQGAGRHQWMQHPHGSDRQSHRMPRPSSSLSSSPPAPRCVIILSHQALETQPGGLTEKAQNAALGWTALLALSHVRERKPGLDGIRPTAGLGPVAGFEEHRSGH